MAKQFNRRQFVAGATAVAAGALCAAPALADGQVKPDGTDIQCDVVVVGAGISGLAAAVQAAQEGAKVVLLEKRDSSGGWGRGTEGIAGVGTSFQVEQDIQVAPVDVIKCEADYMHGRIDNLLWVDIMDNSADTFAWMVENGVRFSGVVDDYRGSGNGLNTFHWFETGTAAESYGVPMAQKAESLGVQLMLNTRGRNLVLGDDGKVEGIVATDTEGNEISIACGAVILATGGVAGNSEYVRRGGYNMKNLYQSYPEMTGDGLTMALEAGAQDTLGSVSALEVAAIGDQPSGSYATYTRNGTGPACIAPNTLWVNGLGERFTSEDAGTDNWMATESAIKTQAVSYSVLTQGILDANMAAMYPDGGDSFERYMEDFNQMIADGGRGGIVADTLDELVALAASEFEGVDATVLRSSIDRYNAACANRDDELFGKPVEHLLSLEEGPFYMVRHYQTVCVTFGAIKTNRSFEALTAEGDPVPGLYAIGVDGVMLWPNIYTINVPGGANANNVNSGRTAARAAWAYINA